MRRRCGICSPRLYAVPVMLGWVPDHPYAVELMLRDQRGQRSLVTWLFARQLLADGLRDAAGLGQVALWPGPRGNIVIRLASPNGDRLAVALARTPVERFLAETEEVVPLGSEADRIDWSSELAALTGSADA